MLLNVVGCGSLGRTLCRLWRQSGTFQIGCVQNRSLASAERAVAFVGAGVAVGGDGLLTSADVTLIGTPDDQIAEAATGLAASGLLRPGDLVFHCSGSQPSAVLAPVREKGAQVGSVHPIHSFAGPSRSIERFAGTFCALEGDASALPVLHQVFTAIGGQVFAISGEQKLIYHAGTVFAANYLVALLEVSRRCLTQAGVPEEQALALLEPIVTGTAGNVFALGTTQALTGPILRGDDGTVARQLAALHAWSPDIAALYRQMGLVAAELAEKRGIASEDALARLQSLLTG